jgi:hypothetical protein
MIQFSIDFFIDSYLDFYVGIKSYNKKVKLMKRINIYGHSIWGFRLDPIREKLEKCL